MEFFLIKASSIYLIISLILSILSILTQIVVLFIKKKDISFSDFNNKVSIGGQYFTSNGCFGIIIFLDIAFLTSFVMFFLAHNYTPILIFFLEIIFIIIYSLLLSRLFKSLYYLINDNDTISYLCFKTIYYDSNKIKELIEANLEEDRARILKDNINYLMSKKNVIHLISEQFYLINELYDSIPYEKKSEKLKEYIESLESLIDSIVDVELNNETNIKNKRIEYFNNEYNKKLDLLIRHNKELKENLNKNFN